MGKRKKTYMDYVVAFLKAKRELEREQLKRREWLEATKKNN